MSDTKPITPVTPSNKPGTPMRKDSVPTPAKPVPSSKLPGTPFKGSRNTQAK